MRIFVLTKRRTSGKDLLADQYGRVYELARGLAQAGHDVAGIAIGYRNEAEVPLLDITDENISVQWQGLTIGWRSPWRTYSEVSRFIKRFRPDILWCSADAIQVIAGVRLARSHEIPVVADLYDNYEAFWITRLPGILPAFRRAVRTADGITCVSKPLAQYIKKSYGRTKSITVIENGVRPGRFEGMSRKDARNKLHLPQKVPLIGTAGSLRKQSGLDTLLVAFKKIKNNIPEANLVLAGTLDRELRLLQDTGIHYLGSLSHCTMPAFFQALDLAIICNRDTRFGRYCYPLKLSEILAAQVPFLAADVGVTARLFRKHREFLFDPENASDLASKMLSILRNPQTVPQHPLTWRELATVLSECLNEAVDQ